MKTERLFKVLCLDTGKEFWFVATNALDALEKMVYTATLKNRDLNATIGSSVYCYILEHGGLTYAVRKTK